MLYFHTVSLTTLLTSECSAIFNCQDCESGGPEICRTEYESECVTSQEVHDVEDDVVECRTEVEEKCEDETSGYTTNTKCSKWPK